jgi:hypothetical protein
MEIYGGSALLKHLPSDFCHFALVASNHLDLKFDAIIDRRLEPLVETSTERPRDLHGLALRSVAADAHLRGDFAIDSEP